MSDAFPVFAALPSLGFVPEGLGLEFVHPQCELGALERCIPFPVVSFFGHHNHYGAMGYLEFNLPTAVESLDQLKAFLAYYLRDAITLKTPAWVAEGRAFSHLLPWERERAAYDLRDRCVVRREWLRLALKDLTTALRALAPSDLVTFAFDGMALSIACGRRIVVQAEGSAWREAHRIRVDRIAWLPKRLQSDSIELSVWKDQLMIGNRCYPVVTMDDQVRDRFERDNELNH